MEQSYAGKIVVWYFRDLLSMEIHGEFANVIGFFAH